MPSKTLRQHKAMAAASHGDSNIGISAVVGKDFLHADKGKKFSSKKKQVKPLDGYKKGKR